MFSKEKKIFLLSIGLIVILLIISQYLLYSKGFYAIAADEAGHTLQGYRWYSGKASIFSIWLPFQKILYGLSFHIYYDLILVPRVLSAVFGIFTLLSLMFLSYQLFGDQIVTLLTGFLGSIFWGLVIFGMLPLLEIYFFFFVISSIGFFLNWKKTNNKISLLFTILFSSLGTTTRYEAWPFTFFIFLLIGITFYSEDESLLRKIFKIAGVGLLMFCFPLVWIYLSYSNTGSITGFMHLVAERYNAGDILTEIKNNVLYYFFAVNIASLNIVGFVPLFFYKKNSLIKIYIFLLISTLLTLSITTFITKAMPTYSAWRLASIWSIMLLPGTAKWLQSFFTNENKYFKYNFAAFILIISCLFWNQTLDIAGNSFLNKEDIAIGKFIDKELEQADKNDRILIEKNKWDYLNILITSQQPDRFITKETFLENHYLYAITDKKEFLETLKKSNIKYLVLKATSEPQFDSNFVEELRRYREWIIYRVI